MSAADRANVAEIDVTESLDALVFGQGGLMPAIIQDDETDEVLMLAWMDREAVRRVLRLSRVDLLACG